MNLQDHLLTLEELLLTPEVRRDPARLSSLLAPDFREFGSSGRTFTLPEIIASLALESPATRLTLSGFTLHAAHPTDDPDWALVTYRSTHTAPDSPPRSALRSSTWVRRTPTWPPDSQARWQLLFHQGTPIPG